MSFSREEYAQVAARQRESRSQARMPMLRALAAVTPKMEALTRDENWNSYLAYISGLIEQLREARDAAQRRLTNPAVVDPTALMEAKMAVAINEAQIAAFEIARDLPKAMMESAKAAQDIIERFEAHK